MEKSIDLALKKAMVRVIIYLLTKNAEVFMKTKELISNIIKNGCVIFTVITVLSYSIGYVLSSEGNRFIPTISWILLFLIFSLPLAAANMILKNSKKSLGARLLLHFAATCALYFVVVVMCGGFIASGGQTLIAMALFLLLYAIFAIVYAIVNSSNNKKKNKKESYSSMFQ